MLVSRKKRLRKFPPLDMSRNLSLIHIFFPGKQSAGLIIGDDLIKAKDPALVSEMQKKKERIMMQSLRRKQQGEENRLRKLEEERLKKEEEAAKEEERNRKKEEERAKREAILAQHKLKKEMDRAEEEVIYIFFDNLFREKYKELIV